MSINTGYKVIESNVHRINKYSYTQDDVEYILEDAYDIVIDYYDEYLSSIELPHAEIYDYDVLIDYNGNPSVIDLTWLKPKDEINLTKHNKELRKIYFNSKNAKTAYFNKEIEDRSFDIDMTINSSFWQAVREIKSFIKNNSDKVNSINFKNVPNEIFKTWAANAFTKSNIEMSFEEELAKTR